MPLAVVHRRQVGRDLAAGFDYYAAQGPGLGEKFLTAVTDVFEAIGRYPRMFAAVHGEVRRAILSDFPYAVFYRIEARRVVILAVLHTARDPRLWPRPRREGT
jgi:plasmid stabilization system protein ParE